ncbi:hypothetical protein [Streptosporangium roseum]|nr:hypothetical protein [Streptosporangium roseum]
MSKSCCTGRSDAGLRPRPHWSPLHDWYEKIMLIWADGGYAGKLVA